MAELAAASGLSLPADMFQARPDALGGAERDGLGERAAATRVREQTFNTHTLSPAWQIAGCMAFGRTSER